MCIVKRVYTKGIVCSSLSDSLLHFIHTSIIPTKERRTSHDHIDSHQQTRTSHRSNRNTASHPPNTCLASSITKHNPTNTSPAMASPSWEWKPYTKTIHRSVYPAISPTNPSNSAAGKVVLVTGGGSGLGKHIAIAFNQARAKAIIITGRRENVLREAAAELKKSGDAKVLFYQADVTDEVALNKAFASAADEVGPIDVVVANAGYMATPEAAAEADVADWWKAYGLFFIRPVFSPNCVSDDRSKLTKSFPFETRNQHQRHLPHLPRLAATQTHHHQSHHPQQHPNFHLPQHRRRPRRRLPRLLLLLPLRNGPRPPRLIPASREPGRPSRQHASGSPRHRNGNQVRAAG